MELNWEDGFSIAVDIQDNAVVVRANRQGLLSLAGQLETLAQASTPGAHFHLDQHNSLEECSAQLIIEKINN
jgi:hypothetical protein